jgi:hypothetical protein
MRKGLAAIFSIALIVTIILLLNGSPSQYSTDLAVGLTLLLFPLWGWAFKDEIKKLTKMKEEDYSLVRETKQVLSYSVPEHDEPVDFLGASKDKTIKNSIYLPDERESNELNFDNRLLDDVYEKALKIASSTYSDSRLSFFSIQVYPYWSIETDDSIIKSNVNIHYSFYSKNSNKVCRIIFNEVDGIHHLSPDEDATNWLERIVLPRVPWKGVNWKLFLNKAFDKVKPLSTSEKTYYDLLKCVSDEDFPWSIVFFDGFSGKKQVFNWNGKGNKEKDIDIQLDN